VGQPRFVPDDVVAYHNAELPHVPHAARVVFGIQDLARARALAVRHTSRLGLPSKRLEDVALAVGELATNSIRHGGGSGVLRIWADDGHVVCEVRDGGHIEDRIPAAPRQIGGYGLLTVNDLADLVRTHTGPAGTAIRLHFLVRWSSPTAHDGRSKFLSTAAA
jgi:anti-sigma regulatory factor (Ser/Thr protein kinase)